MAETAYTIVVIVGVVGCSVGWWFLKKRAAQQQEREREQRMIKRDMPDPNPLGNSTMYGIPFDQLGPVNSYYQVSWTRDGTEVTVPKGKEFGSYIFTEYKVMTYDGAELWLLTAKDNNSVTFRTIQVYMEKNMRCRHKVIWQPDEVKPYADNSDAKFMNTFTKKEWKDYCSKVSKTYIPENSRKKALCLYQSVIKVNSNTILPENFGPWMNQVRKLQDLPPSQNEEDTTYKGDAWRNLKRTRRAIVLGLLHPVAAQLPPDASMDAIRAAAAAYQGPAAGGQPVQVVVQSQGSVPMTQTGPGGAPAMVMVPSVSASPRPQGEGVVVQTQGTQQTQAPMQVFVQPAAGAVSAATSGAAGLHAAYMAKLGIVASAPVAGTLPPRLPSVAEVFGFLGVSEAQLPQHVLKELLEAYTFMLTREKEPEINRDGSDLMFHRFRRMLAGIKEHCDNKLYVKFLFAAAHILMCFICSKEQFATWEYDAQNRRKPGSRRSGRREFGWAAREAVNMAELMDPLFAMCFENMFGRTKKKLKFQFRLTPGEREQINEPVYDIDELENIKYDGVAAEVQFERSLMDEPSLFGLCAFYSFFLSFRCWQHEETNKVVPKYIKFYYGTAWFENGYKMSDRDEIFLMKWNSDLISHGIKLNPRNEHCNMALALYLHIGQHASLSSLYLGRTGFARSIAFEWIPASWNYSNRWWDSWGSKELSNSMQNGQDWGRLIQMINDKISGYKNEDRPRNDMIYETKVYKMMALQRFSLLPVPELYGVETFEEYYNNDVYVFCRLPVNIIMDPLYTNGMSEGKTGIWLSKRGNNSSYRGDERIKDSTKGLEWFWPVCNVKQILNCVKDWADEEEFKGQIKYDLRNLIGLIEGCNNVQEMVSSMSQENFEMSDKPMFWDCVMCIFRLLCEENRKTYTDGDYNVQAFAFDICNDIIVKKFDQGGFFDYIVDDSNEVPEYVYEGLLELLKSCLYKHKPFLGVNFVYTIIYKYYKKMKGFKDLSYNNHVKLLKFFGRMLEIHKDKAREVNYNTMPKEFAMNLLKQSLERRLTAIGEELKRLNDNLQVSDPNYKQISHRTDFAIGAQVGEVRRQDKKATMGRVRWGPIGQNGVNKERLTAELEKFGINSSNDTYEVMKGNDFREAYCKFLVQIGAQMQDSFQEKMRAFFTQENANCIFMAAPIKTVERCFQKTIYDYKEEAKPVGAHILDVVRCAVIYDNIGELVTALDKFLGEHDVNRIKNNFHQDAQILGNYRCVMVNVLIEHPQVPDCRMVCEVQMTLKDIFNIRKKMHKTYKVFRQILPEDDVMAF